MTTASARPRPVPLADRLPEIRGVAGATTAYLAVASVAALRQGNLEFVMYIVVMLLFALFVWSIDRWVVLSQEVLWGLSGWGLLHMLGGLVAAPSGWPIAEGGQPVLYSVWIIESLLKYDHVVHAIGFGVTTLACWEALRFSLRRIGGPAEPTWGRMILCAAAGMGFGALNEVAEFTATLLVPETNVGGYVNTGWDLVANLAGALVAVGLIRLRSDRS